MIMDDNGTDTLFFEYREPEFIQEIFFCNPVAEIISKPLWLTRSFLNLFYNVSIIAILVDSTMSYTYRPI